MILSCSLQVHWNYRLTGAWPYGIMKSYRLSAYQWGKAMVVQTTVLNVLGAVVRAAMLQTQPAWY